MTRLSRADLKRLGIDVDRQQQPRARREPYRSTCYDCGEQFTSFAAETRHVNSTHHARYWIFQCS